MPKKVLSSEAQFQLRQALHIASLSALLSAQRWTPNDLVFQGGTSLHLAHGSPRYSEDLDFLVKASLNITHVSRHIEVQLKHLPWIPQGATLTVTESKAGKNPHSFSVVIGGKNLIPAVKVKVELWRTADAAMNPLQVEVSIVQASIGLAAGMRVAVPTATLSEIYTDKVFALAARAYLKPRDIFDLHWLNARGHYRCTKKALELRLMTYPNETPAAWLAKADARRTALRGQAALIARDLAKWLPAVYPMDVAAMIDASEAALDDGIARMRDVRDALIDNGAAPSP